MTNSRDRENGGLGMDLPPGVCTGPSLRKQPELPKLRGLRNDGLGFSSLRQGCSKRPGEPRCDINASH